MTPETAPVILGVPRRPETEDWPATEPENTIEELNRIAANGRVQMLFRTMAFRLARALADVGYLEAQLKALKANDLRANDLRQPMTSETVPAEVVAAPSVIAPAIIIAPAITRSRDKNKRKRKRH